MAIRPDRMTLRQVIAAPQAPSPATQYVTTPTITSSKMSMMALDMNESSSLTSLHDSQQFVDRGDAFHDQPQALFLHVEHSRLARLGLEHRQRGLVANQVAHAVGD